MALLNATSSPKPGRVSITWLSASLPSIEERRRRLLGPAQSPAGRWRSLAWLPRESLIPALRFALLLALAAITLTCATAPDAPLDAKNLDSPLGRIGTIAQVIGGIYAAMLAVITFGVEQLGARGGWRSALIPWRLRSFRPLTIAAVGLASTAVGTFGPPLLDLGLPINAKTLLACVLTYAALTMLLSLALLNRVVRASSGRIAQDEEDRLLEERLAEALAVDTHFLELEAVVDAHAANTRVRFVSSIERSMSRDSRGVKLFFLRRRGIATDVHAGRLAKLSTVVEKAAPEWQLRLPFRVGEESEPDCQAELAFSKEVERVELSAPGTAPQIQVPEREKNRLYRASRRTLRFGHRSNESAQELNTLLASVASGIESDIYQGHLADVKQGLDWMLRFVRIWMRMAPSGVVAALPRWWMSKNVTFYGPFGADWHEVVRRAAISGSREIAKEIDTFLYRLQGAAYHERHHGLFDYVTSLRTYFLYQSRGDKAMTQAVFEWSDRTIKDVANQIRHRAAQLPNEQAALMPFYDRTLAWCLNLLREAVQQGDRGNAEYLASRLTARYEHAHGRRSRLGGSPVSDGPQSLEDYCMFVAVGWMLRVLEKGTTEQRAVATVVLQKLAPVMPAPDHAAAVWELYHANSAHAPLIHHRLGRLEWEFDEDYDPRKGAATVRTGGNSWIMDGLLFALLKDAHLPGAARDRFFSAYSPCGCWRSSNAKARAEQLIKLLPASLQPKDPVKAITELDGLVDDRELAYEQSERLHDLEAAFDPAKVDETIKLATPRVATAITPSALLTRLATGRSPAQIVNRGPAYGNTHVSRSWLLEKTDAQAPEFNHVVEYLQQTDDERSLWSLHSGLDADSTIKAHELANELRTARAQLAASGAAPDLLVIPNAEWAIKALFGVCRYRLPAVKQEDEGILGVWEGLRVITWPGELDEVVICEASKVFGPVEGHEKSIRLKVIDADSAEVAKVIAQIKTATRTADLPNQTPAILLHAIKCPAFGIADPSAARRLVVDLTGSAVHSPEDGILHTLDGYCIDWEEETVVSDMAAVAGHARCPECFPPAPPPAATPPAAPAP